MARLTEVAALAGVSVEFCSKLERGAITGASASVDGIAFVRNQQQDVLGDEPARPRVLLAGDRRRGADAQPRPLPVPRPRDPRLLPDWELFSEMCVAIMRVEAGRDPHDRGLQDLVGELSPRSETFRTLWGAHDARTHGTGTKRFTPPLVGELVLGCEELTITVQPGLVLMICTAEPGSPSAERLRHAEAGEGPTPGARLSRETHPSGQGATRHGCTLAGALRASPESRRTAQVTGCAARAAAGSVPIRRP
ncbi:hypothetical protein [Naasia sp.]|uniref:MmyB family transcriptional regulator n=1 Tax=Naasia sp. TaxID=2546198 RepID=UPI002609426A|nr:hypothetical protein [Naasia sp.]